MKRVVVTSSIAAIRLPRAPWERPERDDWTDPDAEDLTPYVRSKTIAERAAWDLVRERRMKSGSPPSIPARSSVRS